MTISHVHAVIKEKEEDDDSDDGSQDHGDEADEGAGDDAERESDADGSDESDGGDAADDENETEEAGGHDHEVKECQVVPADDEGVQWSQVSDSWLAKAYMNPDLQDGPVYLGAKPPVEARILQEEPKMKPVPPCPSVSSPATPSVEEGIEDEDSFSNATTLRLSDVWNSEIVEAKPSQNNIFNREALIRLMASLCEKDFNSRLGFSKPVALFLFGYGYVLI